MPTGQESDSDPLESLGLIGPRPPSPSRVISKGRGVAAGASGIEQRFRPTYDPTTDVAPPDADADDWEQALEALRDRQKWQQQGAERLRQAGFSDQDIDKWEKGKRVGRPGDNLGDEENVRWNKRGEGREWDRGKVVSDDAIDTEATWGRLKDT